MILRFVIFLLLNFGALAIGGIFTGKGVPSEWYTELHKAPWTPPGWVFGAAWTTIMICFTFFMTYAWQDTGNNRFLVTLFSLQWLLNVLWNPVFFYYHHVAAGLVIITALTILTGYLMLYLMPDLRWKSLFIAPYFLWLMIATSLNAYILINN